jgi:heat-inducible transcriptional repressor
MGLLDDEKEHILKEYKKEIKRLEDALEQTSEIISRITHYAGIVSFLEWQDKFFYRGISEVLEQPEFRNLDRTRLLIRILEDRQRLLELINRNFEEKVKVYIGQEMGIPEMDSCSMVVSSYRIKERPLGRLAVLGPVRMQYKQIIPALDYISEVLSGVLETI